MPELSHTRASTFCCVVGKEEEGERSECLLYLRAEITLARGQQAKSEAKLLLEAWFLVPIVPTVVGTMPIVLNKNNGRCNPRGLSFPNA
jgi:hypothetical protein